MGHRSVRTHLCAADVAVECWEDTHMQRTDLLTSGDVARRFCVSQEAVRRWVGQGTLRSIGSLSNGTRLFDPADVDKFAELRAQRIAAATGAAR